jgi:hypothetical protein
MQFPDAWAEQCAVTFPKGQLPPVKGFWYGYMAGTRAVIRLRDFRDLSNNISDLNAMAL